MEALLAPLSVFIGRPYLALVPAALFFALCALSWRRATPEGGGKLARRAMFLAGSTWLLYCAWEAYHTAWSKTVVAPIRIDMLLAAPALYGATLLGLLGAYFGLRKRRR